MVGKILLRTGVKEMGRKSDSIDLGFGTLGVGITSGHFQIAGTDPFLMLVLQYNTIQYFINAPQGGFSVIMYN